MLRHRTDLAMEARELWREKAEKTTELAGVRAEDYEETGYRITRVDILSEEGETALGKPRGSYRTVDISPCLSNYSEEFSTAAEVIAAQLRSLLPDGGGVFIAGLGNRRLTPDAIGPLAVEHLLITRHLTKLLPDFRPLSAAAAGVLGTTGLESAEWVRGLVEPSEASTVIVIDALASRSLDRLCTTVQLSDTGIVPGSGIGNARHALNKESLGLPVISIGVPTVVDAATLALDLAGDEVSLPESIRQRGSALFVTPKDVDEKIARISKLIGYAINLALQPGLTIEDIAALLE